MTAVEAARPGLSERELDDLARRLASEVAEELAEEDGAGESTGGLGSDPARRALGHKLVLARLDRVSRDFISQGRDLSQDDEDDLIDRIGSRLWGSGELDRLLRDDSIENVDANRWDLIWVTRADGSKARVPPITPDEESLNELIRQTASRDGRSERRFDRGQPSVSFRLPDGSRLTAVRDVSGNTVFSLRRHRHVDSDLGDLYEVGTVGHTLAEALAAAARAGFNLLVVGGTNAGKTTLLRAIAHAIPPQERLVTVEDALELQLSRHPDRHDDVVELECREQNIEGQGEVTMRYLVRLALRLNPDRVIVGEARGAEIIEMFTAMKQNNGSLGTVHARSSADAFTQIRSYALKAPEHLTPAAVDVDIAASLDWVIHIHRPRGSNRRVVSSLREVTGYDGSQVVSNEVFAPDDRGRATFRGVQFQERTLDRLVEAGFDPGLLDSPDGGWAW